MNTRLTIPVIILLGICAASLLAFPRLSVEHSEPCKNCHFSPSGAGARTEYGNFTTAFNELTLPQTKKLLTAHYRKPRIGEALIIGFDMRYLVLKEWRTFRMQTDGFLTVEPLKNIFYHIRVGQGGVTENYGLLTFADNKYSIRAGTFAPAFGLHNEDHNSYNRSRTGNGPQVYLDGFGLAAHAFGGEAVIGVFNPNGQGVLNFHGFRAVPIGPFGLMLGASWRLAEANGVFADAKSAFGGVSWDRFTAMGEVNLVGKGNDTFVVYGNLTTRLEYGLYLVGEYNFFDPDRHIQTGTDEFWRFSIDVYPMPFVQLRPSYTYYPDDEGIEHSDEFFLQFHVGY